MTVKRSSMLGWTCARRTAPPGARRKSATSNCPSDSSVPTRMYPYSPVTGFPKTFPALDIVSLLFECAVHLSTQAFGQSLYTGLDIIGVDLAERKTHGVGFPIK